MIKLVRRGLKYRGYALKYPCQRWRTVTPINDRQNPVLAVSQLFLKGDKR
jgi:hypothetical protein